MEARVFHTVQDVLAGEARLDQALVRDKRVPNFELLCISKPRSKIDLNFSGKSLILLVEALREREEGCPDFILLDCPAGIEAGFITAITPANEAIIVTTPDVTCLRDADRVAGLLECDGITNVSLLVNRVQADLIKQGQMMSVGDVREMLVSPLAPHLSLTLPPPPFQSPFPSLARFLQPISSSLPLQVLLSAVLFFHLPFVCGLPLLGVIPEDTATIGASNQGMPLVLKKPPTMAGLAMEAAAWRLAQGEQMDVVVLPEEKKGFLAF
ncbi:unnamed protein product [Closterium sp. NIES-65]|nr:unnamed protein product [Closterium sp. NIES-65]CAI5976235.1 unnamed protein product [Closterium sp. NIES-65]